MAEVHQTKLLIIGAGPYGLSLAAYAKRIGIEFIIVGDRMSFWEKNMPDGMLLRSGDDWHLDPFDKFTFKEYIHSNNIDFDPSKPITKELFVAYCHWFSDQYHLEVLNVHIEEVLKDDGKFVANFHSGVIHADEVVVSVGAGYFEYVGPFFLGNIPKDRYAHSRTAVQFDHLQSKTCTIVGGRQSAFEWCALMLEAGCSQVNMVYEHDTPDFTLSDWQWVHDDINEFLRDPRWFRSLGEEEQERIKDRFWHEGRLKLEPWLKKRLVKEKARLLSNRTISELRFEDGQVSVYTKEGDVVVSYYLVLATGYKVDVNSIPFMTKAGLAEQVETKNSFPVLDAHFQCSVPGLFFTGMASTQDFGPYFGFVKGAPSTAITIGRYLTDIQTSMTADDAG